MKVIKKLADMIDDELEGAEHYIRCAMQYKDERPSLAKVFYDLSMTEMDHVNTLHNEVVRIIAEYRKTDGEPPEAMKMVYDYIHEKHIERAAKIRTYQDQYKSY